MLTLAVVAPNALGLVARILNKNKKAKKERYRKLWQEFNLMKKRREIDFIKEENGVCVYRLNDKGKSKIKKFILDELLVAVPGKWDKKWRLVVFDIPERWRKERRAFRLKLQEMGFYQCQKSVWIHPFPCIEEIEFLKDIFKIKPFVKLFIVDEMSDGKVLYHFKEMIKSKL